MGKVKISLIFVGLIILLLGVLLALHFIYDVGISLMQDKIDKTNSEFLQEKSDQIREELDEKNVGILKYLDDQTLEVISPEFILSLMYDLHFN